jgi:hypothetical protein
MSIYRIRNVVKFDLDRCFEVEKGSYEGNEAATRDNIRKTIHKYPEGVIERAPSILENLRKWMKNEA